MTIKLALSTVLLFTVLHAQSNDDVLDGFDDTEKKESKNDIDILDGFSDTNTTDVTEETSRLLPDGLTGKVSEQVAYSYRGAKPHNSLTSVKSSVFLDYEHKFENGWRIKTNGKWYYDAIYDLRDSKYSADERKEQHHEVELFDAYVEGSISKNTDVKLGRQVVVWGRSDTIRITDVLNPLDNRRPGMVDIEDLRLPVAMAKADYFIGDWRVTPIAMIEQRFSKNPAFDSAFNPMLNPHIAEDTPSDVSYALSIGGEFSGWDVNFYGASIRDDAGYIKLGKKSTIKHEKVTMLGTALNIISGVWLFKTELAYFDGLKYTATQEKKFSRIDGLIGTEYKGIADILISYDVSLRHINGYDNKLRKEFISLDENTYQHAFRMSSDFMNATLHANYLISLYGIGLNKGGFQRLWAKYDFADAVSMNIGVVDYIGGSKLFDTIKNQDILFADISYSF